VQPIAWTIIGDIYPPAERAKMQGWLSGVWGASALGGPVLGAFLVEHLHWSLVFWINLPIGAATMAMLARFLKERQRSQTRRVDYAGAALLMLGLGGVMLALVQFETLGGRFAIALAAIGALGLAALAWYEARIAEPIVPFKLWRNGVIAIANFGSLLLGGAMMCNGAFLPTYVQGAMGRSPTVAGLALGVSSVAWTIGTIIGGRLMVRSSYRLAGGSGGVIVLAGMALLLAMTPARGPLWAAAAAATTGFGMGFINTTYIVVIQTAVGWGERGAVTSANMFMRTLGQSLGAALYGAILNLGVARFLPTGGDAVSRLLDPGLRQQLSPEATASLSGAIGHSMHDVYLIATAMAIALLALTMRLPAGLSPMRGGVQSQQRSAAADARSSADD
jgi:MFS family permease